MQVRIFDDLTNQPIAKREKRIHLDVAGRSAALACEFGRPLAKHVIASEIGDPVECQRVVRGDCSSSSAIFAKPSFPVRTSPMVLCHRTSLSSSSNTSRLPGSDSSRSKSVAYERG